MEPPSPTRALPGGGGHPAPRDHYPEDVIAHHGVIEEGTHLLAKPFSIQTLAAMVRAVLDGT